nr:type IA DNA topoisomerase [Eubacterium sp.]
MGKKLFIAEKPSVAQEFAKVLKLGGRRGDGFIESEDAIVTWCVGHLVTMSYPEVYDPAYAKWAFETLPFVPEQFLYEVIPNVKKQFETVRGLLTRPDVESIYVCTDSGREGEYIYRLVDQMAKVPADKKKYRVWIDSQTEDEIQRGIREAKPLSEYDNLSASAYLRAKEDYLMGINFSRALSLKYGGWLNDSVESKKWTSVSVGRVMTCVLGMVVTREWEMRKFVKTPFYRVIGSFAPKEDGIADGANVSMDMFDGEWKVSEDSRYFQSPKLYKENGFKDEETAKELIQSLTSSTSGKEAVIEKIEKKKEKKNPPLLFNLAELQNLSSKLFKISPDETLQIVQELYEKKLVTYPRTDARVLSSAVAKEITKNLKGLQGYEMALPYLRDIAERKSFLGLEKTRYVDDKKITDHYAIIPTGQGLGAIKSLQPTAEKMYEVIVRRFLSIFYPPAEYQKVNVVLTMGNPVQEHIYTERFFTSAKVLVEDGFLPVSQYSFTKKKKEMTSTDKDSEEGEESVTNAEALRKILPHLKKGMQVQVGDMNIKEGETSPPKRYNSGSMILAMENAGQLIEDEELRAMIKGSGIGTSATRAEILKKLVNISYLDLNKKTQIITPTLKGELVCGIVRYSIPAMLSPKLTASWEKGLGGVSEGDISEKEYMDKLTGFVRLQVGKVKETNNMSQLRSYYNMAKEYYSGKKTKKETK